MCDDAAARWHLPAQPFGAPETTCHAARYYWALLCLPRPMDGARVLLCGRCVLSRVLPFPAPAGGARPPEGADGRPGGGAGARGWAGGGARGGAGSKVGGGECAGARAGVQQGRATLEFGWMMLRCREQVHVCRATGVATPVATSHHAQTRLQQVAWVAGSSPVSPGCASPPSLSPFLHSSLPRRWPRRGWGAHRSSWQRMAQHWQSWRKRAPR